MSHRLLIPKNASVLFVSLEMSTAEIFERIMVNVELNKINPLCNGLKIKKNSMYGVLNEAR